MTGEQTCVSLFSGIGGLDLGLARAGFRHLAFCESDAYRRSVLAARWPDVPVYADVRTFGASDVRLADGRRERQELGREGAVVDSRHAGPDTQPLHDQDARGVAPTLLCGGFPCQDLSVAGRRAGLAGERSGLFHEFARIAKSLRPRWLLVENVPGLLSSNGGRDFGVVLGTLADIGYGVAWRVLDSRFFGVPQRRRRVFIVGTLADGDPRAAAGRAGEVLAVGTRCQGHPATRGEARADVASTLGGSVGKGRGHDGNPFDRGGHCSLSGMGSGGPDDNDAQAGRLVALTEPHGLLAAPEVERGPASDPGLSCGSVSVAAPLSHGSNPNSNAAGRRREDDENLVIAGPLGGGNDGIGRRSEDDPNLVAYALRKDPGGTGQGHNTNYVASFAENQRGEILETAVAHQLTSGGGKPGQGYQAVREGASVRRLTPRECERLQGLPDGWTDLGDTADSPRYAALGDAVTATVSEWIGRRLVTSSWTAFSQPHSQSGSNPEAAQTPEGTVS